jgi:hypothetical protein
MKTITKKITLIIIVIIVAVSVNFASNYGFGEETDNVFTTVNNETVSKHIVDFSFEEERYIHDIPFKIECISGQFLSYQQAILVEFNFKEELYIDDM